jgi:23S rRNA pseudouridine2605 synthase
MSDTPTQPDTGDRLAKVIARSGLCSRRDAETWITAGRVSVNGKKVLTPAFNVTDRDKVMVDGSPLAARQGTRVWLYHKPAGLVVTEKDPEGRPTIFQELEAHGLPRVVTVGRLDINTEGLLLLTNDGGLKRVLELPATGWLRRYRVRAHGTVTQAALDGLKDGTEVDGIKYGPIEATLEREQGSNVWLVVALREGKNREVKNVLGALGLEVNRLIRVSYGPFQLNDIPVGGVETVKARVLRDQLGKKLADAADVDFDSEMPETETNKALTGKPTRDRVTGRGTNTVEIARQRFRFTDHAEKTEEEVRAERPRQDRPGGSGGRRPPPRPLDNRRDEEDAGPPRRVHFADDDGRAPEEFVAKRHTKGFVPRDRDDQPARSFGQRPAPTDRKPFDKKAPRDGKSFEKKTFEKKPFDKKPFDRKPFDKKPYGDKPRGPRPQGDERRGGAGPRGPVRSERPSRDFGERPATARPTEHRPRPRPDNERGAGAAFKPETKRPGRNFADKPRSFRPDADRPVRGPRRESERGDGAASRPQAGRPSRSFADKPRSFRPDAERPSRGPRREEAGAGAKPFGKPAFKRDGARPPSGGKPFAPRGGKPGAGRPPGRPAGPRRPKG